MINTIVSLWRTAKNAAALKKFLEKDKVYKFMAGSIEYDQVRVQILLKEEMTSLNEEMSLISAEKNRREVTLEVNSFTILQQWHPSVLF